MQTKNNFPRLFVLLSPQVVVTIVFIVFSISLLFFIFTYSVNILFWDQWDLYDVLFYKKTIWEMFLWQPGIHRQGLIFPVDMILAQITSWNTRVESLFVGFLSISACFFALWLKKMLFKKFNYSDVIIPTICLSFVQYANYVVVPFPSLAVFPLMLVFIYCIAWLLKNSILKYILILIINILLIYSGYGLFIGLITPLILFYFLLHEKDKKSRKIILISLTLSILSVMSFFFGLNPTKDPIIISWSKLIYFIPYVILLFGNFFEPLSNLETILIGGFFSLTLACVIYYLTLRKISKDRTIKSLVDLITIILFSFTFLYSISNFLGREAFGLSNALSSRYSTFYIPLFIGIYFFLLQLPNGLLKRTSVVLMVSVFVVLYFFSFDLKSPNDYASSKNAWKNCYLQYENIDICDKKTNFEIYPNSPKKSALQDKLNFLKQNHLNLFLSAK